jgi:hypothetical protein
MPMKRIGLIVIGLLALATIAVILLKRSRSTTVPPVAVRKAQAVGSVFVTTEFRADSKQNRFTISAPRAAASLCSVGRPEGALTEKYQ